MGLIAMLHYKQHFDALRNCPVQGAHGSCENHEKVITLYSHLPWNVNSITTGKHDVLL
jgi:hypothetical protein